MKSQLHFRTIAVLLALAVLVITPVAQSGARTGDLALDKKNPDNWFEILIPEKMKGPERFADVDGGFYDTPELRIAFSYWTFQNTPNFVRNRGAGSSEELVLVCPISKDTQIVHTKIASRKAVIQSCPETGASNFRYLYYVNFPKLDVFDGETFRPGTFTLTINYDDKNLSALAARIAHSLTFSRNSVRK